MTPDDSPSAPELLAEGRFLRFVRRGTWEFCQRRQARGVVGIAALTPSGCLLLTEQYRPPVAARVIELPAGLAGDEPGAAGEALETAARRELLEETGYEAAAWTPALTAVASAGLTDEEMTLFIARDLRKVAPGGGVDHEAITLHEVPLAQLDRWLADKHRAGYKLDGRILVAAYLLARRAASG